MKIKRDVRQEERLTLEFEDHERDRIEQIRLRSFLMARDETDAMRHFGIMPPVRYIEDVSFLLRLMGIEPMKLQ